MRFLRSQFGLMTLALRRLWFARGSAAAVVLGLVAVVALALSVPLYADAVYHRALLASIDAAQFDSEGIRRPPFTVLFRYQGKFNGNLEWRDIAAIDRFMAGRAPDMLGLPRLLLVRSFETGLAQMFAASDAAYTDGRTPLLWTSVGTLGGLADHIDIQDGRLPAAPVSGPLEVLASRTLANRLGLQTGESYILLYRSERDAQTQLRVKLAGTWIPRDADDPFWFRRPATLDDVLLTSEEQFAGPLADALRGEVSTAAWYMLFDGAGVRSEHVEGLLERITATHTRASMLLPRINLDISPAEALRDYLASSRTLTVQLFVLVLPILLLALAYLVLVVSLTVGAQRNEIAVMRSRGASMTQVMGIAALQAALLAGLALLAAWPAASLMAGAVGGTRSFLALAGGLEAAFATPVSLTWSSLQIGLAAAACAAAVIALPTLEAARHTVVSYKQEHARALRPPWWQRAGLDFLLLAAAAYGTRQLQQQGALMLPQLSDGRLSAPTDPFSNPLLFLVPMLALLALALLLVRLLPLLLRLLAAWLGRLPGAALVLAIRQLARSPGLYATPVLLLTLTLALAAFTASLAATLDQHLRDQVRYLVGGDMSLDEGGESTRPQQSPYGAAAEDGDDAVKALPYIYLPVEGHLEADGVRAATRVARYRADAKPASATVSGRFFGLDRASFPQASFWRADFAEQPLGSLMNALAATYDGVLVPGSLLEAHALQIGDPLRVVVQLKDGPVNLDLRIVGTFRRWPGWYPDLPDGGSLFVGNLDFMFDRAGGQVPYEVWMATDPGCDPQQLVNDLRRRGYPIQAYWHAQDRIDREQARPERQGVFGMLSVGFVLSGLLTVLGFLLYAAFSFRRRAIELGVLRAIGLSARQMAAYLAFELALLLGVGAAAGTGLGYWASRLYIPLLQISDSVQSATLGLAPTIAWPEIAAIYAVYVLLFLAALAGLGWILRRMRLFEAVKMGETA
jgi:putative ABC transport system permease protein